MPITQSEQFFGIVAAHDVENGSTASRFKSEIVTFSMAQQ